jgi:hypothetical protein
LKTTFSQSIQELSTSDRELFARMLKRPVPDEVEVETKVAELSAPFLIFFIFWD